MKLVMFDLDGTLLDSHAFITSNLSATFEAEGLPAPTAEEGRNIIGLGLPEAMRILRPDADDQGIERLVETYRRLFHERIAAASEKEGLYEGALETVHALHANPDILLGVATGKALRGVHRVLELHGLTDMFVTLQTPDHNPSKPHPAMLQTAMVETGVGPEDTLMIGDTTYDIDMAISAGTKALGVSWGSHPPQMLRQSGAHKIIDQYDEMVSAIDQLLELNNA